MPATRELLRLARNSGEWLASQPGQRAGLLDGNSAAVPLLLFGSALAGKAFVPVSYRLAADQLHAVLERLGPGVLVTAPDAALPVPLPDGLVVKAREQFLREVRRDAAGPPTRIPAPEDIAALLFTSGTTGTPKAAVLRQRQLAAYIIGTVEFLSAEPGEAALISVPPYHIAGISAILSSVYAGRRIVQLDAFEPRAWVRLVNDESVTHAMVVPTMLTRIIDVLLADGERLPSLRHLSYGGGRMPSKTIETALRLLPACRFRQRLRPDRDKLDHRRPRPRRSPPLRGRRCRRPPQAELRRAPAAERARSRSAGQAARRWVPASRARCSSAASR